MNNRPSWDSYFMAIAHVVSSRSNCKRRQVAAVIVKDNRIIATGYNGTPKGLPNCNEGGCPRCNSDVPSGSNLAECVCSHAEENAITQAAYHGISIKGATLYTTFSPCLMCAKMIINSGIAEVVFDRHYSVDSTSCAILATANVKLRFIEHDDVSLDAAIYSATEAYKKVMRSLTEPPKPLIVKLGDSNDNTNK